MTTEDIENIELSEVYIENTLETGLDEPSKILCNSPRSVYKERIKKHLGVANQEIMEKVKKAWEITFS
jgi:mRNA-degrading endonuclease toxin of MazEF toxin-antitoxin module